ncbi:S24/S26 family peptidase [Parafrankia discariae]|uniref:S24/S26 family peptidase n=1 Tax=Parafrankia discariae TaxID=365528 RepID=UPI00035C78E8|nr:S24/S26 family peptidase [Parafrankia discariae]
MSPRVSVRAVAVRGESMRPTLNDGDACLVLWGVPPRPGDVVVARLPERGLGVKRAEFTDPDGSWWLRSDNVRAGTDSATFGMIPAGDVLGRVVARYWPRPRPLRRGRPPRA